MHFSAQLWRRGHSVCIVGTALTLSHFGVVCRFSGVIVWKWLYGLPLVTCSSVMVTSRYTPFRHNYSSGTRRTFPALFLVGQNLELVQERAFSYLTKLCVRFGHRVYSYHLSSMHQRLWPCANAKSTLELNILKPWKLLVWKLWTPFSKSHNSQ